MGVFESYLDNRPGKEAGRPDDWMLAVAAPEERLLKFDTWTKSQLATRLQWPTDERRRIKLLGQCATRLEKIALELWRRGWMLEGKALARHILAALDDVAAAQAAGRIKEFYPFFCRVVDSYVGIHAEEIQAEARRLAGTRAAGDLIQQVLGNSLTASIPALVATRRSEINEAKAEKLRVRLSKARLKDSSNDGQTTFL
jgi:hypothetical protein